MRLRRCTRFPLGTMVMISCRRCLSQNMIKAILKLNVKGKLEKGRKKYRYLVVLTGTLKQLPC